LLLSISCWNNVWKMLRIFFISLFKYIIYRLVKFIIEKKSIFFWCFFLFGILSVKNCCLFLYWWWLCNILCRLMMVLFLWKLLMVMMVMLLEIIPEVFAFYFFCSKDVDRKKCCCSLLVDDDVFIHNCCDRYNNRSRRWRWVNIKTLRSTSCAQFLGRTRRIPAWRSTSVGRWTGRPR